MKTDFPFLFRTHPIPLILICLLTVLALPVPAWADVAPPLPPNGSNIEPGSETTSVRMMAGTVTIEVASQSKYQTGSAAVTAVFHMRNLSQTEERMDVRFPLYATEAFESRGGGLLIFPPLENFSVQVNGTQPAVYNTYERFFNPQVDGFQEVPTWANFPVVFSTEKDVEIRVRYIQRGFGGYDHGSVNYVKYTYLLFTGAGWKDTIGSADITVRLPVEANEITVYERDPASGLFDGKEIRWHFENFEPVYRSGADSSKTPLSITVGILQPSYWWKIQETRKYVASHSRDGEAWGQLGKALKEAVQMERGFRQDATGEQWYWESFEAYQKAVELLPNDPDWHYGFADLLLQNTWVGQFERDQNSISEQISLCLRQLRQALDINPSHQRASEMLQTLVNLEWIDVNGEQWVPLVLTPEPTDTARPSQTPTPGDTPTPPEAIVLAPTATLTNAPSPAPANTSAIPPTLTPTFFATTPAAGSSGKQPKQPLCGSVFLPAIIAAALLIKRYLTSAR